VERQSAELATSVFVSPRWFGSGSAGLDYYIEKSIIFAKNLRLRVPQVCHQSAAFGVQCCRICPDFLHGFMIGPVECFGG